MNDTDNATTERDGNTTTMVFGGSRKHLGRVPAFVGLARHNGGVYTENLEEGLNLSDALTGARLNYTVAMGTTTGTFTPDEPIITPTGVISGPITAQDTVRKSVMGIWPDGSASILGQAKGRYQIIQPDECAMLGEAVLGFGHRLVAAGSYGNPLGSKMYLAFHVGTVMIGGKDRHDMYFNLLNSFDAHGGLHAVFAPIRLDCTNQTNMTFGKQAQRVSIRHSGIIVNKIDGLKAALRKTFTWADKFQVAAEKLLATPMDAQELRAFAEALMPTPKEATTPEAAQTWDARRAQYVAIAEGDDHNDFGRGTRYGAYNALTFLTDHGKWEEPVHRASGARRPTALWERLLDGGPEIRLKDHGAQLLLSGV